MVHRLDASKIAIINQFFENDSAGRRNNPLQTKSKDSWDG